jgi:hypothetical protein
MKNARKFKSTNTVPVPAKEQRMFSTYAAALPVSRHSFLFPNKSGDGHMMNAVEKLVGDARFKANGVRTDNSVIRSSYNTLLLERNPDKGHDTEWMQREALKMSQTDLMVLLSFFKSQDQASEDARTAAAPSPAPAKGGRGKQGAGKKR